MAAVYFLCILNRYCSAALKQLKHLHTYVQSCPTREQQQPREVDAEITEHLPSMYLDKVLPRVKWKRNRIIMDPVADQL